VVCAAAAGVRPRRCCWLAALLAHLPSCMMLVGCWWWLCSSQRAAHCRRISVCVAPPRLLLLLHKKANPADIHTGHGRSAAGGLCEPQAEFVRP
jgi:hypothetical protein